MSETPWYAPILLFLTYVAVECLYRWATGRFLSSDLFKEVLDAVRDNEKEGATGTHGGKFCSRVVSIGVVAGLLILLLISIFSFLGRDTAKALMVTLGLLAFWLAFLLILKLLNAYVMSWVKKIEDR